VGVHDSRVVATHFHPSIHHKCVCIHILMVTPEYNTRLT